MAATDGAFHSPREASLAMNAIGIGPFVFAPDRFAAILGVLAFLLTGFAMARRLDPRLSSWSTAAAWAGIGAGRAGHVLLHASSFSDDPLRALAVWQGGFNLPATLLGVASISVLYIRSTRFAVGAVAALFAGTLVSITTLELTRATYSQAPPPNRITTLDGRSVAVADFKGRPVVINLWASWCPPCRREMPLLARQAAARDDVSFLFINQGEPRVTISRYLNREGLALGNVLLDMAAAVSRHYAAPGLPVTLFLRQDGTLNSMHTGEISPEALESAIKAIAETDAVNFE